MFQAQEFWNKYGAYNYLTLRHFCHTDCLRHRVLRRTIEEGFSNKQVSSLKLSS